MNFLADENFPLKSIQVLENAGHLVRAIFTFSRGIPDTKVLAEAIEKEEIIITFDKDFGALIFKYNLPCPTGIVLFRMIQFLPDEPAKILLSMIEQKSINLAGFLTVISENKTRQKDLPQK